MQFSSVSTASFIIMERGSDHVFFWIKRLFDLEKEDKTQQGRYLKLVWEDTASLYRPKRRYEFAGNHLRVERLL